MKKRYKLLIVAGIFGMLGYDGGLYLRVNNLVPNFDQEFNSEYQGCKITPLITQLPVVRIGVDNYVVIDPEKTGKITIKQFENIPNQIEVTNDESNTIKLQLCPDTILARARLYTATRDSFENPKDLKQNTSFMGKDSIEVTIPETDVYLLGLENFRD